MHFVVVIGSSLMLTLVLDDEGNEVTCLPPLSALRRLTRSLLWQRENVEQGLSLAPL